MSVEFWAGYFFGIATMGAVITFFAYLSRRGKIKGSIDKLEPRQWSDDDEPRFV